MLIILSSSSKIRHNHWIRIIFVAGKDVHILGGDPKIMVSLWFPMGFQSLWFPLWFPMAPLWFLNVITGKNRNR